MADIVDRLRDWAKWFCLNKSVARDLTEVADEIEQQDAEITRLRAALWASDCRHWRGRVLTGPGAHWCDEWDGLPVDETTPEWPCGCAAAPRVKP